MDACREFICSGFGNACRSIGRCFCGTEQEAQRENYEPDKHEPAVDNEPMGSESNAVLEDAENNLTKPNIQTGTIYSAVAGSTVILKCTIDVKVHMVVWSKRATHDETFADIKVDNIKYLSGSVVSPSLVITLVDEEDAGTYICRATNKVGDGVSREIKVTVRDAVTNNFSVVQTMMNEMIPKHVKAKINVNLTTNIQSADNVIIGNAGRIQSQNESDETKLDAARDDVNRYVGDCGDTSEFEEFYTHCSPDQRVCRVQFIIGKCVPSLELKASIEKQVKEALKIYNRIVKVEFVIGCIIVSFEITGVSTPSELTAITLADRFRSGINDGSICLTDEIGNTLSIRDDSTRIEVKTPWGDTDESAVPIVSIAQSGYVVIAGEIGVLTCTTLSPEPVTSVKWYRINKEDGQKSAIEVDNNKYFGGSTESPSLVINNTDRHDEGLYMCRAVNGNGEGESPPAFLRIYVDDDIPKIEGRPISGPSNDDTPGGEKGGQVFPSSDDSDETKLDAARDDVNRYVGDCGDTSEFVEFDTHCSPDQRVCRVQFIIGKCEPSLELKASIEKQVKEALNIYNRIVKVEFVIGCISVSFEITGVSTSSELTAITLTDRFRSGINDGSICLTDEIGNTLSIRDDSTRIEVKTPWGDTNESAVPIVSIAQSGYAVKAGEIAVLTCTTLSPEPVTSVKWYRINKEDGQESAIEVDNNKYFGGSTESPSLVINNTDRYDEGLYMCRAVNGSGEGESPPAFLRIYIDNDIPKIEGRPISGPSNDDTPGGEKGGHVFPSSDIQSVVEIVKKGDIEHFELLTKRLKTLEKAGSPVVSILHIVALYGSPEMIECIAKHQDTKWDSEYNVREYLFGIDVPQLREGSFTALYIATFLDRTEIVKSLIKYSSEENTDFCFPILHNNKRMENIFMMDQAEQLKLKHSDLQPTVIPGHRLEKDGGRTPVYIVYSVHVNHISSYELRSIGVVIIRNPYAYSKEWKNISSDEKKVSCEDRERAKKILSRYQHSLLMEHSNLNIINVTPVRYQNNGDDIVEKPCIALYCSTKGVVPLGEPEFPKRLDTGDGDYMEVDVHEGYFISVYQSLPSSVFHSDLKMGCNIGRSTNEYDASGNLLRFIGGTLGPFVKFNNKIGFITCAHVLFDIPNRDRFRYHYNGTNLVEVVQPSVDSTAFGGSACGHVDVAIFDPTLDPSVDVAVVELTDQSRVPAKGRFANDNHSSYLDAGFAELPEYNSGSKQEDLKEFATDHIVYKFGSASDVTKGTLDVSGISVRTLTTALGLPRSGRDVTMKNQYQVTGCSPTWTFFTKGDSGSGVFMKKSGTGELVLVGMGIGNAYLSTSPVPVAVVTPIGSILNALGTQFSIFSFL